MDTNIMAAFEVFEATLRKARYAESTITVYRRKFCHLSSLAQDGCYTPEIGRAYVDEKKGDGADCGASHRIAKERVVHLLEGYLRNGEFDLSPAQLPGRKPKPAIEGLALSLRQYEMGLASGDLQSSTVLNYLDMARVFLLFVEERGIEDIASISTAHLLDFVAHMRIRRPNTDTFYIVCSLRPYLRYLKRQDLIDALKFTPAARRHDIFTVISDEDEQAIALACRNRQVDAKDAAITLLALTTGLRAGDILNLRLGDIDWRTSTLHILQHKTKNPISLPLQPAVADAISEYILERRPDTGDDHVFLQSKAPFGPMAASASIYHATERVMNTVGLSKAGSRLFRRNVATKMLRARVCLPTISAVLGHADPKSTDRYMEMDMSMMRSCVLPLPQAVASCR